MPTIVNADQAMREAAKRLGGRIVRVGTKPWVEFKGMGAAERGKSMAEEYEKHYGVRPPFAGPPWRDDQKDQFDYAVRIDP